MLEVQNLNNRWAQESFHSRLAELAGIQPGDSVLDLGCGPGKSTGALLARVGPKGRVVALDRSPHFLETIRRAHGDAIAEKRLEIVQADVSERLLLSQGAFDVVVCQNVIECVQDKDGLIERARLALRNDGRLLLGHHDFESVVLAATDRELTRRIIAGYAGRQQ